MSPAYEELYRVAYRHMFSDKQPSGQTYENVVPNFIIYAHRMWVMPDFADDDRTLMVELILKLDQSEWDNVRRHLLNYFSVLNYFTDRQDKRLNRVAVHRKNWVSDLDTLRALS